MRLRKADKASAGSTTAATPAASPVNTQATEAAPEAAASEVHPYEAKGQAKGHPIGFNYADQKAGHLPGGSKLYGSAPAFAPDVNGTRSIGVDPKLKHPAADALPANPKLAKANAAALPGLAPRFASSDVRARASAKLAVDGMLASLIADQAELPKSERRDAQQLMLHLAETLGPPHLMVSYGKAKSLQGLNEKEIAERVRISHATLAELGERLTTALPIDKVIFEMPNLVPHLLDVSAQAQPALEQKLQRAIDGGAVLEDLAWINSLELTLSKPEQSALASAATLARTDPAKARERMHAVLEKAEAFSLRSRRSSSRVTKSRRCLPSTRS